MIRLFHGELHQRVFPARLDIIGAEALRLTPVDGDGGPAPYLQSFAHHRRRHGPTSSATSWASGSRACRVIGDRHGPSAHA